MAQDRFIYWRGPPGPHIKHIVSVLHDYLGGAAKEVSTDGKFVTAILHGKPSFPFKSLPEYASPLDKTLLQYRRHASEQHDKRCLEVYVDPSHINVITRMTDEFTNVVADGFATLAARFWKGRRRE